MSSIEIRMKPTCSAAQEGWVLRLLGLGKGYRVTDRPGLFGRVDLTIKRGPDLLMLVQGGKTAVKTRIETLTPGQQDIMKDLDSIGMLCK